jgi:hypothetical protein
MTEPRLSWWSRPGARTLEAIARLDGLIARRTPAPQARAPYCCSLAKPASSNCYSTCLGLGGDYWIQYWWCCYGSYRYQCQECTTHNDCYTTDVYCSGVAQGPSC